MIRNVSRTDANARRVLGVVLLAAAAAAYYVLDGTTAIVAMSAAVALAVVMFATAQAKYCPIYHALRVSSLGTPK